MAQRDRPVPRLPCGWTSRRHGSGRRLCDHRDRALVAPDAGTFHFEVADNGGGNSITCVRVDGSAPRIHTGAAHDLPVSGAAVALLGVALCVCDMGQPSWRCRAGTCRAWSRDARRAVGWRSKAFKAALGHNRRLFRGDIDDSPRPGSLEDDPGIDSEIDGERNPGMAAPAFIRLARPVVL